jgi:hypothetical protein
VLRPFLHSLRLLAFLAWRTFFGSCQNGPGLRLKRIGVMVVFLPVFALIQALHWIGFFLDECLFRDYRRVKITEPLFVLGIPRSGTTFLHHVLSQDSQFTTFQTWECLFAPSVAERHLWAALARLDRWLGRPFGRLLAFAEGRVFSQLQGVHTTALMAPEEDYLTLIPIFACFILVLPFPCSGFTWQMGTFDRDMPEAERRLVMSFYRASLQKHLHFHGAEKRLLSKNASFAPLVGALQQTFPDCRIICCMRDPLETVPSQLSALRDGLALFGNDPDETGFRQQLMTQLTFYYHNLLTKLVSCPKNQRVFISARSLKSNLKPALTLAYARLGITLTDEMSSRLETADGESKQYTSGHRYALADFGLNAGIIRRHFADAYGRYDFVNGRVISRNDNGSPTANASAILDLDSAQNGNKRLISR